MAISSTSQHNAKNTDLCFIQKQISHEVNSPDISGCNLLPCSIFLTRQRSLQPTGASQSDLRYRAGRGAGAKTVDRMH